MDLLFATDRSLDNVGSYSLATLLVVKPDDHHVQDGVRRVVVGRGQAALPTAVLASLNLPAPPPSAPTNYPSTRLQDVPTRQCIETSHLMGVARLKANGELIHDQSNSL